MQQHPGFNGKEQQEPQNHRVAYLMPRCEAMSLGCPVICSNTSSIPEVVGDAGEYFDPNDPESICAAIESVLESRTRRDELVTKGYGRCALFSWARCATETLTIYRSLV